ncbi:MAG: prepilin-type N-terminal cleavage/methylation domain-containing protein [Rhodocyclales bacterium]|nr:prepilin-type N-terminal cleavage/methylation domain-containing protein [Rhodocyclales bacterium]
MRNQQSGFTLVEIAIVLVIIGLLLGGVLKGQELINSAKVKNFANDFRNISTFVYAYQDKYRATPGDDSNPQGHVGATANAAATTNGTAGNARIEGAWNSALVTDETVLFWQQVRLAGLATGTTVVPASATITQEYVPKNADGGRIGITGDAVLTGGGWSANFFVCSGNIQGRFARQLDTTIDDGNTATGSVRVIGQNEAVNDAGAGAIQVLPANDATLYTVCMAN